ncbi:hypothetical protein ACFWDN_21400 [Micromonospora chalcea]
MRTRLLASLADHMRDADDPRAGVLAAASAAKAEALRNGWTPVVAHALGELVASMGGDLIGHAALALDAERALKEARAAVRRAETAVRRAVETSQAHPERIARHRAKLAAARRELAQAEASFRELVAA